MSNEPHDRLFKATFGQAECAISHFERFLPELVRVRLDLASAELRPGSFVDEDLRSTHTDLLYAVSLRGGETDEDSSSAFVYILFEHQSSEDARMPFRLLKYMVRIWDAHLRESGGPKLPLIIPLVLYHGARSWRSQVELIDLMEGPQDVLENLGRYVPTFEWVLNDLTQTPDVHIRSGGLDGLVRLLFKYIRSEDLEARLPEWSELFQRVIDARSFGLPSLALVIEYVLSASELSPQAFSFLEPLAGRQAGELVMSTAARLKEEGRNEGLREGRNEGLREGLIKGLLKAMTLRFGRPSSQTIDKVSRGRVSDLQNWTDRILEAESLEQLLQD